VRPQFARPVAIAIIRRGDEILVVEVPDAVKDVVGWRPPGGTIEFGERGADTVVREIREEFGVEIADAEYVGTLENIFSYLGATGHEIVRVYAARFVDPKDYDRTLFECIESDGGGFTCVWKKIADFGVGAPLYPEGLLDLIR
jgi:ADP-ribose pyrophosphatase YjhB (NUDIX family)